MIFSDSTNQIIERNKVLVLQENGNELYGENWSITKSK